MSSQRLLKERGGATKDGRRTKLRTLKNKEKRQKTGKPSKESLLDDVSREMWKRRSSQSPRVDQLKSRQKRGINWLQPNYSNGKQAEHPKKVRGFASSTE